MTNKRLNLTLEDSIWVKVDKFRDSKFQSRQDFIKSAVVEYITKLQRYEDLEKDETTRMLRIENERLHKQLDKLISSAYSRKN